MNADAWPLRNLNSDSLSRLSAIGHSSSKGTTRSLCLENVTWEGIHWNNNLHERHTLSAPKQACPFSNNLTAARWQFSPSAKDPIHGVLRRRVCDATLTCDQVQF